MRLLILPFICLVAGCSPVIEAQLQLIQASRHGLANVRQSVDERTTIVETLQSATRTRLDAAFDADVRAHPSPIDATWIIDARKAYASAIDALHQQQQRTEQASAADRETFQAIDQAMQQLELLNRTQLKLVPDINSLLKGTP